MNCVKQSSQRKASHQISRGWIEHLTSGTVQKVVIESQPASDLEWRCASDCNSGVIDGHRREARGTIPIKNRRRPESDKVASRDVTWPCVRALYPVIENCNTRFGRRVEAVLASDGDD